MTSPAHTPTATATLRGHRTGPVSMVIVGHPADQLIRAMTLDALTNQWINLHSLHAPHLPGSDRSASIALATRYLNTITVTPGIHPTAEHP